MDDSVVMGRMTSNRSSHRSSHRSSLRRQPGNVPRSGNAAGPIVVAALVVVTMLALAMTTPSAVFPAAGAAHAASSGETDAIAPAFASKPTTTAFAPFTPSVEHLRPAASDEHVSIWHIPHPDDETIGMAGAILAEAVDGRRNIVVFYTNGEASDVRLVLNGLVYCTLHGRFHKPHEEGYERLDKAAFGRARLHEAIAALARLGVATEDVVTVGLPDGGVAVDDAFAIVKTLDYLFPDAAHRTTALTDPHPDHRNLARALYRLLDEKRDDDGGPPDVRFFSVYAYDRPANRRNRSYVLAPVQHPGFKEAALAEFAVWNPHSGRFAIGMHSVPRLLVEASTDRFEYVEPQTEMLTMRHRLRRNVDLALYQHKAAIHVDLARRVRLRFGVTFAGEVRPPTVFYEASTMFNALTLRFGVGPTDWRLGGWRWSLAGLQVFNRFLLEYDPNGRSTNHGLLRIGWKFDL